MFLSLSDSPYLYRAFLTSHASIIVSNTRDTDTYNCQSYLPQHKAPRLDDAAAIALADAIVDSEGVNYSALSCTPHEK